MREQRKKRAPFFIHSRLLSINLNYNEKIAYCQQFLTRHTTMGKSQRDARARARLHNTESDNNKCTSTVCFIDQLESERKNAASKLNETNAKNAHWI